MSPPGQADRRAVGLVAVAFLREAGSGVGGKSTYWPFHRARAPWLREIVEQLTGQGLVEVLGGDCGFRSNWITHSDRNGSVIPGFWITPVGGAA